MIVFDPKNIKRWMMLGTRNAFGAFLTELAADYPEVFAMTADFTKSTGLAKFKEQFPNQFLTAGIAEQNMIALASGLASEGHNVFACSFASFVATRCYEQVKINLGYMQHNVKLVGIASGLGVSFQGNTHYGLDDVSLMRTIPGMTIIVPSDCTEVAKATIALVNYNGPAYLRLVGEGFIPIVNPEDYEFTIGKGIVKREGTDVLIIANGTMVNQSLKVAEELEKEGISAGVVNMHTVKPLDTGLLNEYRLTYQVYPQLGSAVAEHLAAMYDTPKMIRLGVQDVFPHAGSYTYLLQQCGLDIESIKNKIINLINN